MPLMCMQCAMKAIVEGREPATTDESVEEHMARVHPDPEACQREREQLEAKLTEIVPLLMAKTRGVQ